MFTFLPSPSRVVHSLPRDNDKPESFILAHTKAHVCTGVAADSLTGWPTQIKGSKSLRETLL